MSHSQSSPPILSLLPLSDSSSAVTSSVPLHLPLFTPSPQVVRFEPNKQKAHAAVSSSRSTPVTQTKQLQLTNRDHVARRLTVSKPDDECFTVVRVRGKKGNTIALDAADDAGLGSSKVAPGMSVTYQITYTPRDSRPHSSDLVVTTERERFIIPLRAEGERPSMDLPASMEFGTCPVNHTTVKTMMVRNNGSLPMTFAFSTVFDDGRSVSVSELSGDGSQQSPFTCEPAHGILQVEESIQVLVSFTPTNTGSVNCTLIAELQAEGAASGSEARMAAGTGTGKDESMLNATSTTHLAALSHTITPAHATAAQQLGASSVLSPANIVASSSSSSSPLLPPSSTYARMQLSGSSKDVNIRLSSSHLVCDPTHVTLSTAKSLLLHNDSDIPIHFTLCQYSSTDEDRRMRTFREEELRRQEAEERDEENFERLVQKELEEELASRAASGRDVAGMDGEEEESLLALARLRADQSLVRKYTKLHRALASSSLTSFAHPLFSFDPSIGELWPKGSVELTCTFAPDAEGETTTIAYVEVSGREKRLPLRINGRGKGAEARFSYTQLDIGSVFMNAVHEYQVILQNIGNIPAHYQLLPPPEGEPPSRFKFTPSSGTLAVIAGGIAGITAEARGQQPPEDDDSAAPDHVTLNVTFSSPWIGEFVEVIRFALAGTAEPITIMYKGKVIGPTFEVEEKSLDFGEVAYGFPTSRLIHIRNSSAIPMKIHARIQNDTKGELTLKLNSSQRDPEHMDEARAKTADASEREARRIEQSGGGIDLTATTNNVAYIAAYTVVELQLDLLSYSADKHYDSPAAPYAFIMDVEGVGDELVTLPIFGVCRVPALELDTTSLDFGSVFLRHAESRTLNLKNSSDLPARFIVHQQDEASKSSCILEAATMEARVEPHSTYELSLSLTAQKLGAGNQPCYIEIPGSDAIPFVIRATYSAHGPRVSVDPKNVNFGPVSALKPVTRTVTLHNDSPIPAHFKCFMHRKASVYSVDASSVRGVIQPHGKHIIHVTADLNETLPMPDTLHIVIRDGDALAVPLRSTGTGSTIASTLDAPDDLPAPESESGMTLVELGDFLINTVVKREFRLENRGRRTQLLQWEHVPPLPPAHPRANAASNGNELPFAASSPLDVLARVARLRRIGPASALESLPEPLFTITPTRATLEPGMGMVFTLSGGGSAAKPGLVEERWVCKALIGQEKKVAVIADRCLRATFVTPLLAYSTSTLYFDYKLEPGVSEEDAAPPPQELSFTNRTSLPLKFKLIARAPFVLSAKDFMLEPAGSGKTLVSFRPVLADFNRESALIKQEIQVAFEDQPQREKINLVADLCFPNLTFSNKNIDFGAVLNDTQARQVITVTNNSKIVCTYQWMLQEKPGGAASASPTPDAPTVSTTGGMVTVQTARATPRRATPNAQHRLTTNAATLPLNECFDILPIRGQLQPGESEEVEFVFYGHTESRAHAAALCLVEDGPDYELSLKGQASSVGFKIDRSEIHFGYQEMFSTPAKHITLTNSGKVTFEYSLTLPPLCLPLIDISPSEGRLRAGERVRIQIRLLTAIPDAVDEIVMLRVGFYDPLPIHVSAHGVFPQLYVDLPRADRWMEEHAADEEEYEADVSQQSGQQTEILSLSSASSSARKRQFGGMTIEEIDDQGNVLPRLPLPLIQQEHDDQQVEEKHQLHDDDHDMESHYTDDISMDGSLLSSTRTSTTGAGRQSAVPAAPVRLPPLMSDGELELWHRCLDEASALAAAKAAARQVEDEEMERELAMQREEMEQAMANREVMTATASSRFSPSGSSRGTRSTSRSAASIQGGSDTRSSARFLSPSSRYPVGSDRASMRSRVSTIVPQTTFAPVEPPADWLSKHPDARLEIEAERLFYKYFIIDAIKRAQQAQQEKMMQLMAATTTTSKKAAEESKESKESEVARPNTAMVPALPTNALRSSTANFSVSRFVVDFGALIKNSASELKFSVTNLGGVSASYSIDKRVLHNTMFSIEPTVVTRLPPGASTTFKVICRAANPKKSGRAAKSSTADALEGQGITELDVPMLVRNGPPSLIRLRAHITVPDVSLSQTKLDFGRVPLNQRREITVQLHNRKPVPAVWSFSNAVGSNVTDKDLFTVTPDSGTLAPGERVNVVMGYMPALHEERKSIVRLPLRITSNPRVIQLQAQGTGVVTRIRFDPPTVLVGPSLPFAPSAPTPFVIHNLSDRSIELYSLDFDQQFHREEAILREDESFDTQQKDFMPPNAVLMHPRLPGEGLNQDVITRWKLRMKKRKRLEEEAKSKSTSGDESVNDTLGLMAPAMDASLAGDSDISIDLVRNILVVGAPYAGKTVFARALAPKLDLQPHQVISIDSAVRYFFELQEKENEEKEVLANKEKEYSKEAEKLTKKLSKEKRNGQPLSENEIQAGIIAELGPLNLESTLKVTDAERELAVNVRELIVAARARIHQEQQEALLAAKQAAKMKGSQKLKSPPSSSSNALASPSTAESGRNSPATAGPSRSKRGSTAALHSTGPTLFEPDAELLEYMHANSFFDLRGQKGLLSEEMLSELLCRFILIRGGEVFKTGVIIDGVDSCFTTDPAAGARVVRSAFDLMSRVPPTNADGTPATATRDNNLHVLVLDVERDVARARQDSARSQAHLLVDDESLTAALKKFKLLAAKDMEKLGEGNKKAEYERQLDLYQRRREAELMLYQIDHVDPTRFDTYWKGTDSTTTVMRIPTAGAATATAKDGQDEEKTELDETTADFPSMESVTVPMVDPLADVLAALDVPSFPPAYAQPPIPLPPDVAAQAEAAEESRAEVEDAAARAEREEAETRAREEEEATKGKGKGRPKSRPSATPSSDRRGSSSDGRPRSATKHDAEASLPPVPVPAFMKPGVLDGHPMRVSSVPGSGLCSVKFLKLRRFESSNDRYATLNRLLATCLPWIEEMFRIEFDARSADPTWIPPPKTWQIVRRPAAIKQREGNEETNIIPGRRHRRCTGLQLVDPVLEEQRRKAREIVDAAAAKAAQEAAAAAALEEENKAGRGKKGKATANKRSSDADLSSTRPSGGKDDGSSGQGGPEIDAESLAEAQRILATPVRVPTRWQMAPRSSLTLYISFASPSVGTFPGSLGFEIVGVPNEFEMNVESRVDVPSIVTEPRNVFMNRVKSSKHAAAAGITLKRVWIPNEGVFDFGPLLMGKDPNFRYAPAGSTLMPAPTNGLVNNASGSQLTLSAGPDAGGLVNLVPQSARRSHGETWRITNAGTFPAKVDLTFLNNVDSNRAMREAAAAASGSSSVPTSPTATDGRVSKSGAGRRRAANDDRSPSPSSQRASSPGPQDKPGDGKKGGKSSAAASAAAAKAALAAEKVREQDRAEEEKRWESLRSKSVFWVEPCNFELGVDESRDITVWAFPQAPVVVQDTLVATVRDNPVPVLFPVRCLGAKPSVAISRNEVVFDRLLLNQVSEQYIDIWNDSPLPLAWQLTGLDGLPSDGVMQVGPQTCGILSPNSTPVRIFFRFSPRDERRLSVALCVEVRDVEGFLGVVDRHTVQLKCESYQNKARIEFGTQAPTTEKETKASIAAAKEAAAAKAREAAASGTSSTGELLFPLMRVHDVHEQRFSVINDGSYEVRYKVVPMRSAVSSGLSKLFTLTPAEGIVAPGARSDVVVTFHPDREVNVNKDTQILFKVQLFESGFDEGKDLNASTMSLTAEATKKIDVPITAHAVYSRFHLLPSHGITFGPIETGVTARRTLKLFNDGSFDFEFRFYPLNASHPYARPTVLARLEEMAKAEAAKASSNKKGSASLISTLSRFGSQTVASGSDKKKSLITPRDRATTPLASNRSLSGDKTTDRDGKKGTAAGKSAASSNAARGKGGRAQAGDGSIPEPPSDLELGVFNLSPVCGLVPAGQSIDIDVSMLAEIAGVHLEALELEISNQDPATLPPPAFDGSPVLTRVELSGESCAPGIDVSDVDAIFEEQEVRDSLERRPRDRNFFAKEEKVFVFAPVIASASAAMNGSVAAGGDTKSPRAPSAPTTPGRANRSLSSSRKGAAAASPSPSDGSKDGSVSAPSLMTEARVERFRIANPFKVSATVHCQLSSSPTGLVIAQAAVVDKKAKGGKNAAGGATPAAGADNKKGNASAKGDKSSESSGPVTAFSLDQSTLVIPPREHRYVSVRFQPPALASYNAYFEAVVEGGADPMTRCLSFEVRGEGTLPALNVMAPTSRDEESNDYVIDFNRLLCTPSQGMAQESRSVVLRNDGLVPATARFDLLTRSAPGQPLVPVTGGYGSPFGFSGRGRMVTVAPGGATTFTASFTPPTLGFFSGELRMSIVSNPFEGITFQLKGEAYSQDVTMECDEVEVVPLIPVAGEDTSVQKKEKGKDKEKDGSSSDANNVILVSQLTFPDTSIGQSVSHVLTLTNHGDVPYRFAWSAPTPSASVGGRAAEAAAGVGKRSRKDKATASASDDLASQTGGTAGIVDSADPSQPDFIFTPSIGHIAPHSSKRITLTFRSPVVRQYVQALTQCALQRIRYLSPEQVAAKAAATTAPTTKERASSAERRRKQQSSQQQSVQEEEKRDESVEPSTPYVPDNTDWDNSQQIVRWVTEEEAAAHAAAQAQAAARARGEAEGKGVTAKGKSKERSSKGSKEVKSPEPEAIAVSVNINPSEKRLVQLTEVAPEPTYELVDPPVVPENAHGNKKGKASATASSTNDGSESARGPGSPASTVISNLDLRLNAVCDLSRYELSLPAGNAVNFRPTFMYQTRVFNFTMSNPGRTKFQYDWKAVARHATKPEMEEEDEDEQEEEEIAAFTIEPKSGFIPPNSTETFKLSFHPLDSLRYETTFISQVDDESDDASAQAQTQQVPPKLIARGQALRPKCHFELQTSDYLSAKRRPANLPGPLGKVGPLDASVWRVVEVNSVGVRVTNITKFYVVNPTNVSYAFQWMNEDPVESVAAASNEGAVAGSSSPPSTPRSSPLLKSPFKCLTPRGVIESGRKFEMKFSYTPEVDTRAESFWRFVIPKLVEDDEHAANNRLEVPLLLVGSVSQPRIELDRTFLNFHALIVGRSHTETIYLRNDEGIPSSFQIDRSTYDPPADPSKQVLIVSPTHATIPPHSQIPIEVTLRPMAEQSYNFNVHFIIKRKASRLAVNIKGEGYALRTNILLVDAKEEKEGPERKKARQAKEAEQAAAAAAAASSASVAPSQPSSRVQTASKKDRQSSAAPSLPLPAASPSASSSAAPVVGGESDISHHGLDLSAARELVPLSQLAASGALLTASGQVNHIDFGLGSTHERRTKHLILSNDGKFQVDFSFNMTPNKLFTITPSSGQIRKGNKMIVDIVATSPNEHTIERLPVTLHIGGSKQYTFTLSGTTKHPLLHFSSPSVEFGQHFVVDRAGLISGSMPPLMTTLRIANHERINNIAIDLNWVRKEWMDVGTPMLSSPTDHAKDVPPTTAGGSSPTSLTLTSGSTGQSQGSGTPPGQVHSLSLVLAPGSWLDLPLFFSPLARGTFHDVLSFEVNNGLYFIDLPIGGVGIPLKLDLEEEGLKCVDFGTVRSGAIVKKSVRLINKSKKAVTFALDQPMGFGRSMMSASMGANQSLNAVTCTPTFGEEVTLRPRDGLDIVFTFAPQARLAAFTSEVNLHLYGMVRRLVLLTGACLGVGCRFDSNRLDFGSIVSGSTLRRSVLLQNIGDVSCRFKFETTTLGGHYTIRPAEGLVPATHNQPIEIIFHPTKIGSDKEFIKKATCKIEDDVQSQSGVGGESSGSTLKLQLSGCCDPPPTDGLTDVRFDAPVRTHASQTITLVNDSNIRWNLRPSFHGAPFWSGEPHVEVPPGGRANYTIHYRPWAMTAEPEKVEPAPTGKGRKGSNEKKVPGLPSSGSSERLSRKASLISSSGSSKSLAADSRPSTHDGAALTGTVRSPSAPTSPYNRPKVHEGNLFFPLPTGTALSYRLIGSASSPPLEGQIDTTTQAKRVHVISCPIRNWLAEYQRFKVIIERIMPTAAAGSGSSSAAQGGAQPPLCSPDDASTSLSGPPTIDVPGHLERVYKLHFYAYKECITHARVTFLNESSGESVTYEVKVTAKDVFVDESALAPMSASVRQLVTQQLQVKNPLDHPVTFNKFICANPALNVPVPFTLPAKCEGFCTLRFRPISAHKDARHVFSLLSDELGEFPYAVTLSAAGVGTDRIMRMEAELGQEVTQTFRFVSYATKPSLAATNPSGPGSSSSAASNASPSMMEYECRMGGSEFRVEPSRIAVAWADPLGDGIPVAVEVKYEPSNLGEIRDLLTIVPVTQTGAGGKDTQSATVAASTAASSASASSSAMAGSDNGGYTCLLIGSCLAPKPSGPLIVPSSGTGASVRFKNVLSSAETFHFSVENSNFTLAKRSEKVPPKTTIVVPITYRPGAAAEDAAARDRKGKSKTSAGVGKKRGEDGSGEGESSSSGSSSARADQSPRAASNIGKLTITCAAVPQATWVTYLQGTTEK